MILSKLVTLKSGSPQFRITESKLASAPTYIVYAQNHLLADLRGVASDEDIPKIIRTEDEVTTTNEGDIIFNLMTGVTSIVSAQHVGYLYTQNFVRLELHENIEPWYLVYLLNESPKIKRQLLQGVQGSSVLKYTLAQLRDLQIPKLPNLGKQELIGKTYAMTLRRKNLMERVAQAEEQLILQLLKGLEN